MERIRPENKVRAFSEPSEPLRTAPHPLNAEKSALVAAQPSSAIPIDDWAEQTEKLESSPRFAASNALSRPLTDAAIAGFDSSDLLAMRQKAAESIIRGEKKDVVVNGEPYVISRPETGGIAIQSLSDWTKGASSGLLMHVDPKLRHIPKDPKEVETLKKVIKQFVSPSSHSSVSNELGEKEPTHEAGRARAKLRALNEQIAQLGDRYGKLSERPKTKNTTAEMRSIHAELLTLRSQKDDVGAFLNAPLEAKAKGLDDFLLTKLRDRSEAATKIQAQVRGHQARKAVVMPSELEEYLKQNLTGLTIPNPRYDPEKPEDQPKEVPVDAGIMSKALAREILEKAKTSADGVRYEAGKTYEFPIFDGGKITGTESIRLPVGLWVRQTLNGGVELEMIGKKLGAGGFKEVYRSRALNVDLTTSAHNKNLQNAVVVQAKPGQNKVVLGGMDAIARAFTNEERKNPDLRLAGELSQTGRISPTGQVEARDAEYQGDFANITQSEHPLSKMSMVQTLRVLADTGKSLSLLHQKSLVHGDVKFPNVLVGQEAEPRGYLSDFDSLKKQGQETTIGTPGYVDQITQNFGRQTEFTDVFALAKMTSQAVDLKSTQVHRGLEDAYKELQKLNAEAAEHPESQAMLADRMASLQKIAMATIKELDSLKELIAAVRGVQVANSRIVQEMSNSTRRKLLSGEDQKIKEAIAELNKQFPQYHAFMDALQSAVAKLE